MKLYRLNLLLGLIAAPLLLTWMFSVSDPLHDLKRGIYVSIESVDNKYQTAETVQVHLDQFVSGLVDNNHSITLPSHEAHEQMVEGIKSAYSTSQTYGTRYIGLNPVRILADVFMVLWSVVAIKWSILPEHRLSKRPQLYPGICLVMLLIFVVAQATLDEFMHFHWGQVDKMPTAAGMAILVESLFPCNGAGGCVISFASSDGWAKVQNVVRVLYEERARVSHERLADWMIAGSFIEFTLFLFAMLIVVMSMQSALAKTDPGHVVSLDNIQKEDPAQG